MPDPSFYLIMASAALAGLAMLVSAGLAGWRSSCSLSRSQPRQPSSASARIEIADLRERIRKLEAIAAGVDL